MIPAASPTTQISKVKTNWREATTIQLPGLRHLMFQSSLQEDPVQKVGFSSVQKEGQSTVVHFHVKISKIIKVAGNSWHLHCFTAASKTQLKTERSCFHNDAENSASKFMFRYGNLLQSCW